MIFETLLAVLVFLAVTLVAGNNLASCVGPAVGARILTKSKGELLGAVGFTSGLVVQGSWMSNSVNNLIPNSTVEIQATVLVVAILIFIIANLARVPLSLSMSLVGLLSGAALALNLWSNIDYISKVAVMWIIAPIVAALLAFFLLRFINSRKVSNIWRRIRVYKLLLIVLAFTSAYTLGANTLGLIVATAGFNWLTVSAAILAIFAGSFFLSKGTIRRVAQEFYLMRYSNATVSLAASTILVEFAAVLSIPLSNTQTTTAAVFGAGISYRTRFLSLKPYMTIIAGWIVAPAISFAIGYLIWGTPWM